MSINICYFSEINHHDFYNFIPWSPNSWHFFKTRGTEAGRTSEEPAHGVTWRGTQLPAHSSNCESLSIFDVLRVTSSETGWQKALFSLNIFSSHKINAYLALSINNTLYFHNILFFFILYSKYIKSSSDLWKADMVIQYLYMPCIT